MKNLKKFLVEAKQNTYGSVLNNKENVDTIYNFLKKALMEITENTPYRGKSFYSDGDFSYKNKLNETDNSFYGTEFIYFRDTCVYKAYYRGGLVLENNL